MAKAYEIWQDKRYLRVCCSSNHFCTRIISIALFQTVRRTLQSAIRCGKVIWEKGLLVKGPGICHGIAGNAYAFILLYRLTGLRKYIYKANKFAAFTYFEEFKAERDRPDYPQYSLFEGQAGLCCLLSDLLNLEDAMFPFMPCCMLPEKYDRIPLYRLGTCDREKDLQLNIQEWGALGFYLCSYISIRIFPVEEYFYKFFPTKI